MRADLARLREMERAATLGEWAVDPDDRPDMHWNNHIVSVEKPHYTICFMTHDNTPENVEGEANAALIVALKNQFSALADRLERMAAALQTIAICAHDNDARDIARQALAEPAQGEKEE